MSLINRQTLKQIMPEFRNFLETEGKQWIKERKEKEEFFAKYFTKEEIDNLEEGTLRELIHLLWAYNMWSNKDKVLEEMLTSGLPTVKKALKKLLYGDESLAERFDFIKSNVRMMGAASISEMLAHHNHKKYPIWNNRSRKGVIELGIDKTKLPKSSQISGIQYESFQKLMLNIHSQIADKFPDIEDLFKLDFFLYFISTQESLSEEPTTEVEKEITTEDFEHDEVIDQILELGDGLGFDVQKEFSVMHGCRIDALWRSRIANLGTIAYAFEVHRRGSRDSAILNLQRVKRDPTIQKVVVVSSRGELGIFKNEIESLSEDFRNSVGYFEVGDLQRALDYLQQLKEILRTLGLLSVESFFD